MTFTRRQFAPAAALATLAASPAFAQQTSENVKWRLTSSFPKSLDTLFGASNTVAKVVGELTDGKFQLQVFSAGEIVPVAVKVAVPPTSRSTAALGFPLPLAGQLEPAEAVQVQLTPVISAGKTSVTVAPVTPLGPAFVTTIV